MKHLRSSTGMPSSHLSTKIPNRITGKLGKLHAMPMVTLGLLSNFRGWEYQQNMDENAFDRVPIFGFCHTL